MIRCLFLFVLFSLSFLRAADPYLIKIPEEEVVLLNEKVRLVSPDRVKNVDTIYSRLKKSPVVDHVYPITPIDEETTAIFFSSHEVLGNRLNLVVVNNFTQPELPIRDFSPFFIKNKLTHEFSTNCLLSIADSDIKLSITEKYREYTKTCCFSTTPFIPNKNIIKLLISYTHTDIGTYAHINYDFLNRDIEYTYNTLELFSS